MNLILGFKAKSKGFNFSNKARDNSIGFAAHDIILNFGRKEGANYLEASRNLAKGKDSVINA